MFLGLRVSPVCGGGGHSLGEAKVNPQGPGKAARGRLSGDGAPNHDVTPRSITNTLGTRHSSKSGQMWVGRKLLQFEVRGEGDRFSDSSRGNCVRGKSWDDSGG